MTIVQDKPPTTSQPSAGDLDIGSTSGEGGEVARIVGSANPEFVVSPFHTFSNSPIMFSSDGAPRDIDTGVGNVKPGELGRVSDLLDGSSKYVQKCSLNDIMFLVMLILIKSTSEQRESRFEGMMA
ncbi:MAG: hypothetical protein LBQ23_00145, partial [Puniceicoccales bacterium]|nr:hypothetical protein [Puniceicoccales bacterium]